MEPENLALNLGSQAVVALTIMTLTRYTQPTLDRIPAPPRSVATRSGGGQIWHALKQRWLKASGKAG